MFGELIIIIPFYLLFLTAFYIFYIRRGRSDVVRRQYFRALKEILLTEKDVRSQEKQLILTYKKLTEAFSSSMSEKRRPTDLIEDFIFFYDARGENYLERVYKVEADKALRDRAYILLEHIRSGNPFSTLPAKEASLLRTLVQAIDTSNKDLATSSVLQLAQNIEILDSAIQTGERRTRTSYIISIVGVVLTLFFGFSSFIQRLF